MESVPFLDSVRDDSKTHSKRSLSPSVSFCSVETSSTAISRDIRPHLYQPVSGNECIRQQSCSCKQKKTPKKKRLVILLVVIIMILLSITVGMAWKHLELLRNLRGQSEKTSDMFGDVLNNNSVKNSTNEIVYLLENKV